MPVTKITPYLYFNGDAEAALELYRGALGAKIGNVARYADMPTEHGSCPPEQANHVMNAVFHIGDIELMCSDRTESKGKGNGDVQITLYYDDAEEMRTCFERLAAGGEVMAPIHDAFWGDTFGALKDRFGIGWQFIKPGSPR